MFNSISVFSFFFLWRPEMDWIQDLLVFIFQSTKLQSCSDTEVWVRANFIPHRNEKPMFFIWIILIFISTLWLQNLGWKCVFSDAHCLQLKQELETEGRKASVNVFKPPKCLGEISN